MARFLALVSDADRLLAAALCCGCFALASSSIAGDIDQAAWLSLFSAPGEPSAASAAMAKDESLYRREIERRRAPFEELLGRQLPTPQKLRREAENMAARFSLSGSSLAAYTAVHPFRLKEIAAALPLLRQGSPLPGEANLSRRNFSPRQQLRSALEEFWPAPADSPNPLEQRQQSLEARFEQLYQAIVARQRRPLESLRSGSEKVERQIDPLRARLHLILSSAISPAQRQLFSDARRLWLDFLTLALIYGIDPLYAVDRPLAEAEASGDEAALFPPGQPLYYHPYPRPADRETEQELAHLARGKELLFQLGIPLPSNPDSALLYEEDLRIALVDWPSLLAQHRRDRARRTPETRLAPPPELLSAWPRLMLLSLIPPPLLEQMVGLLDQYQGARQLPWPKTGISLEWQRQSEELGLAWRGALLRAEWEPDLLLWLQEQPPDEPSAQAARDKLRPFLPCLEHTPESEPWHLLLATPEPGRSLPAP